MWKEGYSSEGISMQRDCGAGRSGRIRSHQGMDSARKHKALRANRLRRAIYLSVVPGVVLGLIVFWLLWAHGPTNAAGATTPKFISGSIYDPWDQPASGAEVTVEIWGGSWPDTTILRTSQSTVADTSGYFEVEINANYWGPHNTIRVRATDWPYEGAHSVEANGDIGQTVDVNLNPAIPEFNIPMAMLLVCAFVAPILCGRAMVTQRRS